MIETSASITVPFYDVDSMEIAWHGNYAKYLEIARCELLDKIGYNYLQMRESGYIWPIIDMRIRYIKSTRFGQKVCVNAKITEWENRLKIDYLITDKETGERLTKAHTIQVAVTLSTGEMCFVSPTVLTDKLSHLEEKG
ncbi:MAG: acyl-CoA thioesterase [Gammaproteobacteria bacterium]|nr:acyl-CoA thioesterase [Gammaproteobacteria bacterium]